MSQVIAGYETVFITKTEITDAQMTEIQEKLQNAVKTHKGDWVLSEDWGSRKLAYPIQKEARGRYSYVVYTGKDNVVAEVERNLRLNEHVVRFLSVQVSKEFSLDAFNKGREDLKAQAKKREEEREARMQRRAEEAYDDSGSGDY